MKHKKGIEINNGHNICLVIAGWLAFLRVLRAEYNKQEISGLHSLVIHINIVQCHSWVY